MAHRNMSLQAVVDGGLCSGCGVCAYLQPQQIRMVDVPDEGLRPAPVDISQTILPAGEGARACPGSELSLDASQLHGDTLAELRAGWGPVRQLWEGYSSDAELRYAGSSAMYFRGFHPWQRQQSSSGG